MAASETFLPDNGATEQLHGADEEEYVTSEYGDADDDPETLWNTYLRGVRFHGDGHAARNKPRTIKKAPLRKEKSSPPKSEELVIEQPEGSASGKVSEETEPHTDEVQTSQPDGREENETAVATERYTGPEKKPRMRTIAEVISRIQWDPDLPAENFSVGYLDRFAGLMEKPFQFFSWEDLASVDYDVLAVPKHRIVYVKYRDQKVWDKNERLDLVFGSTESSKLTDIRDLVQQIETEYQQTAADYTNHDSDSDDSEDDVIINIEKSAAVGKTVRLPECRPNYFVAVRVTDPTVISKIAEAKQHMLSKDARIYDMLMPDGSLHITMAMLKLDDTAEIAAAANALENCRERLKHFFTNPIAVELQGLSTFNGYVLYAPVRAPPAFYELQKSLLHQLAGYGVRLAHEHDFVPHMTVLKLTRSRARMFQSPYIDPFIYVDDKDCNFGIQLIDNLQLCVIGEEKRWDGFYNCAAEVYFA